MNLVKTKDIEMEVTVEKREEDKEKQYRMHKDFFNRCRFAIDNGFFMEAILMEYAALESRLESILGVLGLPCNKYVSSEDRRKVNISHRVHCLKAMRKAPDVFEKTKLPSKYFDDLDKWIGKRNIYIHGLYKDEIKYSTRIADTREFAERGYELCRLLYNEATRIRRLYRTNERLETKGLKCYKEKCCLCKLVEEET